MVSELFDADAWDDVAIPGVSLTDITYHRHVRDTFGTHGKPDVAQGQIAYMRHQFDYFGLKMPAWTALTREIHQARGLA